MTQVYRRSLPGTIGLWSYRYWPLVPSRETTQGAAAHGTACHTWAWGPATEPPQPLPGRRSPSAYTGDTPRSVKQLTRTGDGLKLRSMRLIHLHQGDHAD